MNYSENRLAFDEEENQAFSELLLNIRSIAFLAGAAIAFCPPLPQHWCVGSQTWLQ
jgi:hypothetical protein